MNRVYRLVFSAHAGDLVAVGENARRRPNRGARGGNAVNFGASVQALFAQCGLVLLGFLAWVLVLQILAPDGIALGAIATGIAKQLRYKAEGTWGVAPGTGSAQLLRRVSSSLDLRKQTYRSQELRSDYQVADMRHGVRSIEGTINGELSAGTWKDFFAAALRKVFVATTPIAGASITIAGSGPTYTVTRAAGSFLTDGIKAGDVVRLTAGSFNAANLTKNLWVLSLTATVLTVMPLNGAALVAEGPISAATVSVPGKRAWVPATGHVDNSFAFEHWHSDVSLSELFLGCKVRGLDVACPPSGLSTIALDILGKDVTPAASAYYVTPTAETTTGALAAVNGLLAVGGTQVALLTGLSLSAKGNHNAEPVAGSNTYADITEGSVDVDGQLTALFQDATLRDLFINETESSLMFALAASNLAAADFITFVLPRIKVGGAGKDDGEKGIVQTLPFTGLYNFAGGAGQSTEQTTLLIQDSQA